MRGALARGNLGGVSNAAAEELLNLIATDLSVNEYVRAQTEHPEWMPDRSSHPAAAPIPDHDLTAVLEMSGLSEGAQESARGEAGDVDLGARIAAHGVQTLADLLESTYSTQQAAGVLDLHPSNIRRAVQQGRWYAVRVAGKLRLPTWQFVEETTYDHVPGEDAVPDVEWIPLPNLAALVPGIPAELHPLTVAGFMTTSQPELEGRTPVEWLAGGGGVIPVVELLEGLSYQ